MARLVEKTTALETLIEKLTCSNQQLVALVVEQHQYLRKLSENISIPTTTTDNVPDANFDGGRTNSISVDFGKLHLTRNT